MWKPLREPMRKPVAEKQSKARETRCIEGPVRMCIICRQRFAKAVLTRHILTSQGILRSDAEQIEPGRGWYLCTDDGCAKRFAHYRPGTRRTAAAKRRKDISDADSSDKGVMHV